MAGVLRVVCTPIGNLEDISLRAKRVLAEADVILAENIANTKKLLQLLELETEARVVSCSQHEELDRVSAVIERLEQGASVALISDAGAPAVSDPGGRIVEAVTAAGFQVEVVPGPSALTAALMGAGLKTHHFLFLGFLPKKGKERRRLIEGARDMGVAMVIYESPLRAEATLEELAQLCPNARVVVARELTKRFETFHRGLLGQELTPALVLKGEMVIVVEAADAPPEQPQPDPNTLVATSLAEIESGRLSMKQASKHIAAALSISPREAYQMLLLQRH